jgi:hypothetical protein
MFLEVFMRISTMVLVLGVAAVGCGLQGCNAAYETPRARADFSALGMTPEEKASLTDAAVQKMLDRKPMVQFPATIAVARVQAGDYSSYSYHYTEPYPRGAYSVISKREVEKDEDFKAIEALPKVSGVGQIKGILLDRTLHSDLELRAAAAKLHADLLLCYTFETEFFSQNSAAPLSVISLGIFPTEVHKVRTTASAMLMDVNNGYVYAVVEATASNDQLSNAWASAEAADQVRLKTERQAFVEMVKQFVGEWPKVLKTYDKVSRPEPKEQ